MEDTHTILDECEGLDKHSFVAVYDGHGGPVTAQYAGANMMKHITDTDEYKKYVEAPEKDTKVREGGAAGGGQTEKAWCGLLRGSLWPEGLGARWSITLPLPVTLPLGCRDNQTGGHADGETGRLCRQT